MALPSSGTITLDMIRNEFGGSNPISLSQYYRGGGRVPDIAQNAAIPTSGAISFSNFYGATNAFYSNPLTGGAFYYTRINLAQTTAIMVNTNGTLEITNNGTVTATHQWYNPTTTGIGNTHWVRFTRTSETLAGVGSKSTTASTGWLALTAQQSVQAFANATAGTIASARGIYTVEIATDSGGSNIVCSGSYDILAESDKS